MSETYSVVLTGKLLNDETLDAVKANVGGAFKLKEAQVDKLFSGKPVALKRGLDKKQAVRLSTRLQQLGAHAVIKSTAAKPAPAAEPVAKEEPAVPFTDIVAAMPEPGATAEPEAEPAPVAEVEQPAVAEVSSAQEQPSVQEAAPQEQSAVVETEQASSNNDDISCPRCGHEQPFTTACGHCKMDLTMHIKRLERKAKVLAARRA